jgi:pyrimidine deaminase RibD-like protein
MFTPADHEFMTRAIELARKGLYTTTPNPRVGCVIVQEQLIVGEGWHHRAGEPHAEVIALGEAALGPLLAPATREAIRRAQSPTQALTLLFSAPEFQRR